jgi:hypothetical protein
MSTVDERSDLARQRAAKAVNQGQDANLHAAPTRTATAERPSRATPSPGTPRREGRGFVDSYGQDRVCAATGCATRLSQYNGRSVCGVHDAPSRG